MRHRSRPLVRRLRWAAILVVAAWLGVVALISQAIVSPPRPRISDTARPVIGVVLREGAERNGAVLVRTVPPARDAGLEAGDVVLRAGGAPIRSAADLEAVVADAGAGDRIEVEARRPAPDGTAGAVLVQVEVVVRPLSPTDVGLEWSEASFTDAAGRVLRGWYVPPPAAALPAPAVAYGHGNGTDRRHFLGVAWAVHEAGFAQLLFDFAGRGESEGSTISLGPHEAEGLRAALDFLASRPGIDAGRLALAGRSMGAAAAILEARDDPRVRALALDSPFTDLAGLVDDALRARHLPPVLFRPPAFAVAAIRARFEPLRVRPIDAVAGIRVPILLFHGEDDRLVPFADAREIAAAAAGPVELVPLPGAGHNTPRPDDYGERIAAFLSRAMTRSSSAAAR